MHVRSLLEHLVGTQSAVAVGLRYQSEIVVALVGVRQSVQFRGKFFCCSYVDTLEDVGEIEEDEGFFVGDEGFFVGGEGAPSPSYFLSGARAPPLPVILCRGRGDLSQLFL